MVATLKGLGVAAIFITAGNAPGSLSWVAFYLVIIYKYEWEKRNFIRNIGLFLSLSRLDDKLYTNRMNPLNGESKLQSEAWRIPYGQEII